MNGVAKMFRGWALISDPRQVDAPVLECPCGWRVATVYEHGQMEVPNLIDAAMSHAFTCEA